MMETHIIANEQTKHQNGEDISVLGFWIYLMTDLLMFAVLFATYAVLRNNTYGGITIREIVNLPLVLTETIILLTSSLTCGLGVLATRSQNKKKTSLLLGITVLLGITFLVMELSEFSHLLAVGHSYQKSAFLSAYFTLVGTHGLHILIGSAWILLLLVQIFRKGLTTSLTRKITLAGLFWHFLDVVWIFIFTMVYLMGAIH